MAPDAEAALIWIRKAAEQGLGEAMYELGVRYERGTGSAPSGEEALRWYEKAADAGIAAARPALRRLSGAVKNK